jgi:hypothetical protein
MAFLHCRSSHYFSFLSSYATFFAVSFPLPATPISPPLMSH